MISFMRARGDSNLGSKNKTSLPIHYKYNKNSSRELWTEKERSSVPVNHYRLNSEIDSTKSGNEDRVFSPLDQYWKTFRSKYDPVDSVMESHSNTNMDSRLPLGTLGIKANKNTIFETIKRALGTQTESTGGGEAIEAGIQTHNEVDSGVCSREISTQTDAVDSTQKNEVRNGNKLAQEAVGLLCEIRDNICKIKTKPAENFDATINLLVMQKLLCDTFYI